MRTWLFWLLVRGGVLYVLNWLWFNEAEATIALFIVFSMFHAMTIYERRAEERERWRTIER